MGLFTATKAFANLLLAPLNLRLDSRTAERAEAARLERLVASGHFDRPIFPLLPQFQKCDPAPILAAVKEHEPQMQRFTASNVSGQFSFANDYYMSPDAEVLYSMVRLYKPRRIVEVGSGNSTLLFRHAIADGGLETRLTSIDPLPRREITGGSDRLICCRVEEMEDFSPFAELERNDILFIDSSHEIKPGNDVLFLLLKTVPGLAPGVLVHVHDIFLPYEYPHEWIVRNKWNWTEQYLVHALLAGASGFEVLWAGHYFQRTLPGFQEGFKYWKGNAARALWLRRMG